MRAYARAFWPSELHEHARMRACAHAYVHEGRHLLTLLLLPENPPAAEPRPIRFIFLLLLPCPLLSPTPSDLLSSYWE